MVSRPFSTLSAVRKQHLLVEFSSLKYACPHGVFVSLTPGDPTLWSGVIFVRKGPYGPSILRFQISFPPTYPSLPPLVTFSTDIFHPLITPLTTYMYTTDIQDSGTVSATDDERLPPGGFSLRHGFPGWFGRASRRSAERVRTSAGNLQTPTRGGGSGVESPGSGVSGSMSPTPRGTAGTADSGTSAGRGKKEEITTYEVLRYIRSTFDDEEVLDSVPLEAAGNPGAWHAWRTHRIKSGKLKIKDERTAWHDGLDDDESSSASTPEGYQRLAGGTSAPSTARRPGEWNWDGVWEVRVKKGVDASITESVLFGKDAGDDLIRFLHLDPEQIESIKENIKRSLEVAEPQRRGIV
ncbi:UBC-like protein [Mollisia scopiformis]|uniref:UBC-like protein n=1 Tax=Mollisia scopiformis TaxID=149040 RepID=A0A194XBP0_MOLSC|nr:UBC-like protein [Mollisia scopiformis]KUJ17182.1 UBC-like protein [Mollisia scopiformis]